MARQTGNGHRRPDAAVLVMTVLIATPLAAGCQWSGGASSPPSLDAATTPVASRTTSTPSTTRASTRATPTSSTSSSGTRIVAPVTYVFDGDTIEVAIAGRRQRVRLLGVDAPEVAHSGSTAACGGVLARTRLTALLLPRTVVITKDAQTAFHDRYGRLLGYVTVGRTDASMWLLREGLAEAWRPRSSRPPARWASYAAASAAARQTRAGSWATCTRLGR